MIPGEHTTKLKKKKRLRGFQRKEHWLIWHDPALNPMQKLQFNLAFYYLPQQNKGEIIQFSNIIFTFVVPCLGQAKKIKLIQSTKSTTLHIILALKPVYLATESPRMNTHAIALFRWIEWKSWIEKHANCLHCNFGHQGSTSQTKETDFRKGKAVADSCCKVWAGEGTCSCL